MGCAEVARRNPDKHFVIAGKTVNPKDIPESLKTMIFLGSVTDGESKALMTYCRAFLHPSKFEGFGIPPLEALSCGTPIAISNASCLPEVYGDCAHYFDPDDYDVDLDALLAERVAPPEQVLGKYTWEARRRTNGEICSQIMDRINVVDLESIHVQ